MKEASDMSLITSLRNASGSLTVLDQALSVTQNNINNAATPGYSVQRPNIVPLRFDPGSGFTGGIASGVPADSRNVFADAAVQSQAQQMGFYKGKADAAGSIQSLFDVSGSSGVSASLSALFSAFSALSVSPSDQAVRQGVMNAAETAAGDIRSLAHSLEVTAGQVGSSISASIAEVNRLAAQVQVYNANQVGNAGAVDPAAGAQLHSSLESLAQLVNISVRTESDGTVTLTIGNGSPLVLRDQQFALQAQSSASGVTVTDGLGIDVTRQLTSGSLGGQLDARNRILQGILGGGSQSGSLNRLTTSIAGTVNGMLAAGKVSTAAGAAAGLALFSYDNADPTRAAATLRLNPALTSAGLAPADQLGNSGAVAQNIADLATAGNPDLDGLPFIAYFGSIASDAGREAQQASANFTTQQQVFAQAQSLRDSISGVSLDEQAAQLLQYQRAYQAIAKTISVVNSLLDSALSLIPQ